MTYTDFDGDKITLSADRFVIEVVDDIPVLKYVLTLSLNERDLSNYLEPTNLLLLALGAPVVGSHGNEQQPDGALDVLLGTASAQGLLNEIIGTNVVHGGSDEFGAFDFVTEAAGEAILTNMQTPWTVRR